MTSHPFTP